MTEARISLESARRMALHAQLLGGAAGLLEGKEGAAQTVDRLGYVQIDTIAVVQRAHHHVLWTRRGDYVPEMLDELQAVDRRVFEYWTHALSYVPVADYRFYLPRMRASVDPIDKWEKDRLDKYGHLMAPILERIRQEGPLGSRDFPRPAQPQPGEHPHPAKAALDLLFLWGEIMVAERRNFQRYFDLTERVLPSGVDTTVPDEAELGRFQVRRALAALGVAQEREIQAHIPVAGKDAVSQALVDLLEAGEVVRLGVGEAGEADDYALAEQLEGAAALSSLPRRVYLLSPFDNLIIQRERTRRLFGFDYTLECYTPPAKRVYGYFVLPILWGDRLVGRLDPKTDRKKKTLVVLNLVFEEGVEAFDELLPALSLALGEFARFNGCREVTLEQVTPGKVRGALVGHIQEALAA